MARKRILIVEDDAMVRDVLVEGLSDEYIVDAARSAFEAMVLIWKNHPDLVVTDLNMFELDGITLARNILSNPAHRDMKFMLISGYLNNERINEWQTLDKDAVFLAKPFTITEIKNKIDLIFKQGHPVSLSC